MEAFFAGFIHPLIGWDHLVVMVAVGLWAVQLGGRALYALPLTFVSVMAAGGAAGFVGMALPGAEAVIAVSVVALAVVVTARARPPLFATVSMVALFAFFHGHAHALEAAQFDARGYAAGFLLATAMLHLSGVLVALAGYRALARV